MAVGLGAAPDEPVGPPSGHPAAAAPAHFSHIFHIRPSHLRPKLLLYPFNRRDMAGE